MMAKAKTKTTKPTANACVSSLMETFGRVYISLETGFAPGYIEGKITWYFGNKPIIRPLRYLRPATLEDWQRQADHLEKLGKPMSRHYSPDPKLWEIWEAVYA